MQSRATRVPEKRFNTLTLHSLSTRDNLRDFIVAAYGEGEWGRSDVDAEREVNNEPVINETHLSSLRIIP